MENKEKKLTTPVVMDEQPSKRLALPWYDDKGNAVTAVAAVISEGRGASAMAVFSTPEYGMS